MHPDRPIGDRIDHPRAELDVDLVKQAAAWRVALEGRRLGAVSINIRITAVRNWPPRPPITGSWDDEEAREVESLLRCRSSRSWVRPEGPKSDQDRESE